MTPLEYYLRDAVKDVLVYLTKIHNVRKDSVLKCSLYLELVRDFQRNLKLTGNLIMPHNELHGSNNMCVKIDFYFYPGIEMPFSVCISKP